MITNLNQESLSIDCNVSDRTVLLHDQPVDVIL